MKTTRDELMNWWLEKYHNTNVEGVIKNHPEEVLKSADWFKLYPVTQEQEKEWINWAKDYIKKKEGWHNALLERTFPFIYLNTAPYVKEML